MSDPVPVLTDEEREQIRVAWRGPWGDELVPVAPERMVLAIESILAAHVAAAHRAAGVEALREAAEAWLSGESRAVRFNKARRDETPDQRIARWLNDRANLLDPKDGAR